MRLKTKEEIAIKMKHDKTIVLLYLFNNIDYVKIYYNFNKSEVDNTVDNVLNNIKSLYYNNDLIIEYIAEPESKVEDEAFLKNKLVGEALEDIKKGEAYLENNNALKDWVKDKAEFIKLNKLLNESRALELENKRILAEINKHKKRENLRLKKELERVKLEQAKRHTKIAIHTVSQFYGDNKQLSLFSEAKIDAFKEATGLNLTNRPDNYGVVLNQSQRKVFEGILKAFTDTNYLGDEQKDKKVALKEVYSDTPTSALTLVKGDNAPYKNIDVIPVLKLTQAQIIELSGYDLKSQRQGDKQDVIEALTFLAINQFCFYWVRLKTENGKPVKDKSGDYVKEEVMEVGTLLRIKTVRDQTGLLQYYEIQPSAPLLDQVNNYFLLVPNNWRDEVKELTGKRASSYTYEFLLWLRLQSEQIRRYNSNNKIRKPKDFKLTKSWEDVAIALKMPESMYKANRKRASKIIEDAYSTAISLGYLLKVENNGATDILFLNEKYYPKPGELV